MEVSFLSRIMVLTLDLIIWGTMTESKLGLSPSCSRPQRCFVRLLVDNILTSLVSPNKMMGA